MMKKIGFVIDSTFGIYENKQGLQVVPLKVMIDQNEYVDGAFDYRHVVEGLQKGQHIKTSQPTPQLFIDAIETLLKEGYDDVVVLTLSKTLSGTFNSANLAKEMMNNDHVHVLDTMTTISGGQFIVTEALSYAKDHDIIEVLDFIDRLIHQGLLLFTVDNLKTLVKNGRLSRVQALIGNILKIKPVLMFDQGVLEVVKKVRSKENLLKYICEFVEEKANEAYHNVVYIQYIEEDDTANTLKKMIEVAAPFVHVEIKGVISPVISAHVGLGALGIYFVQMIK